MFISEDKAYEAGRKLIREGKAKRFSVKFRVERDPDTREVMAGYRLFAK